MEFNSDRTGTGTAEWAEHNENICLGCSNGCLYCYAAHNAARFKKRDRASWTKEELTHRSLRTSYPKRNGVVMFPTAHDITINTVDAYIRVAKLILDAGNRLLIVTKPTAICIALLLPELSLFKEQILFRFSIGTIDPVRSVAWEPGAPLPRERISCLATAFEAGFNTSVSIEPIVGGVNDALAVVLASRPYVTDSIWIGKMNHIRSRVDMSDPAVAAMVAEVEQAQCDSEIMRLVACLHNYNYRAVIRWKDSIKSVISRMEGNHD